MPADLSLIDHIAVEIFREFQARGKRRPPLKVLAAAMGCSITVACMAVARLVRDEAIAIPPKRPRKDPKRNTAIQFATRRKNRARRARVDERLTSSP